MNAEPLAGSLQRMQAAAPPPIEDMLCVAEIGIVGLAATCAARHLGLDPIDALLAIFFTTTLTGQFLLSLLKRRPRA
jgi:hypothetical protein